MSMILGFIPATDDQIRELLEHPKGIREFISSAYQAAPSDCSPFDLDKSWHALHYIFTGSQWEGDPPANTLLRGGKSIGKVDVGYGPAKAVSSTELAAFSEFLSAISDSDLASRYDPAALAQNGIYPEIWADTQNDAFEYVQAYFESLRSGVQGYVARDLGAIVFTS